MSTQPFDPSSPPSSRVPTPAAWDLEGDLDRLGLLSVLQFLESTRVDGAVLVTEPNGAISQFTLAAGMVTSAVFRSLRGREALLAILGIKSGRFGFQRGASSTRRDNLAVAPAIMDAVRLEDELERMAKSLPGPEVALALRNPHEVPIDPLECGMDTVMAAIAARPGVCLHELRSLVPLAPVKLRVSVACLAHNGRLHSEATMTELAPVPWIDPDDWYARLLLRHPGGLRLLMGTSPHDGPHDIIAAITALARALDAGPAWLSVAADGSSIARVRPRAGGLLSIASVPMHDTNTELFRRFAGTATLVLLCVDAPKELAAQWREASPSQVPLAKLRCSPKGGCVFQALREFALVTDLGGELRTG